jgi:hypothetical protein
LSIPGCYGEKRWKYNWFLYFSTSCFPIFLFLTLFWTIPNVSHFSHFIGEISINSPIIKLQPKTYDYIMFALRILFIPSLYSQISNIVICLSESRGLFVKILINNRHFFDDLFTGHSHSFHTFGYLVQNYCLFTYLFNYRAC